MSVFLFKSKNMKKKMQNLFFFYFLAYHFCVVYNYFCYDCPRASKICCPIQRNATFFIVCTFFTNYDDTNRKQEMELLVFSFEEKWHKESQKCYHRDYSGLFSKGIIQIPDTIIPEIFECWTVLCWVSGL